MHSTITFKDTIFNLWKKDPKKPSQVEGLDSTLRHILHLHYFIYEPKLVNRAHMNAQKTEIVCQIYSFFPQMYWKWHKKV